MDVHDGWWGWQAQQNRVAVLAPSDDTTGVAAAEALARGQGLVIREGLPVA